MSIWTTVSAPVIFAPAVPVISVGNLKGGVGKTAVVMNLACALVKAGLRVLAIDLDFQGSLSISMPPQVMPRNQISDGGVNILLGASYDMFHDSRITARGIGAFSDLSLVRTSFDLADVEDRMFAAFVLGKHDDDQRFALARKLANPLLAKDFDVVLIDTPPRLTIASVNALCASTHVLIPTALMPTSYSGAVTFARMLENFQHRLCPRLNILAILPTFTHSPLNDAEVAFLKQIKIDLPQVAIWREEYIPRRQPIADNKALAHAETRERFEKLANKLIEVMRLKNGINESRGTRERIALDRQILPQ